MAPFCSIAQTVAHLLILRLTFYIPPHSSLFFTGRHTRFRHGTHDEVYGSRGTHDARALLDGDERQCTQSNAHTGYTMQTDSSPPPPPPPTHPHLSFHSKVSHPKPRSNTTMIHLCPRSRNNSFPFSYIVDPSFSETTPFPALLFLLLPLSGEAAEVGAGLPRRGC